MMMLIEILIKKSKVSMELNCFRIKCLWALNLKMLRSNQRRIYCSCIIRL